MAANHKLTGIIKGRTVKGINSGEGTMSLVFDDGSVAKIKTGERATRAGGGGDAISAAKGKTIKSLQQKGSTLTLAFTDHTSTDNSLAEATSSVMIRDKAGSVEYAD